MDDKREARADGGRRFQREGPTTENDLDMAMVVRDKKLLPFQGALDQGPSVAARGGVEPTTFCTDNIHLSNHATKKSSLFKS